MMLLLVLMLLLVSAAGQHVVTVDMRDGVTTPAGAQAVASQVDVVATDGLNPTYQWIQVEGMEADAIPGPEDQMMDRSLVSEKVIEGRDGWRARKVVEQVFETKQTSGSASPTV